MPVRDRLRAVTREAHERVDHRFSRYDLGDPEQYRGFLEAHHAVLPACERMLEASGAANLVEGWAHRVRTPALVADLVDLGAHPARDAPTRKRLTPAAAFGMMYVLEGSRLGGAILARRVLAGASIQCRGATRYLRHGEGLRLWPSFLAALEASSEVHNDPDAVVASAIETFGLFEPATGLIEAIA